MRVVLRPTVSRPVCIDVRHSSRTRRPVWREDGSFTISPDPRSAIIVGSESRLTHNIFYCLWDSVNLKGQIPVFISSRKHGGPVLLPDTGFNLLITLLKSSWFCNRRSVGQLVLMLSTRLGPMTKFLIFFTFMRHLLCSYMGHPLWREDLSVFCSTHHSLVRMARDL
jgi:hypothetical protein